LPTPIYIFVRSHLRKKSHILRQIYSSTANAGKAFLFAVLTSPIVLNACKFKRFAREEAVAPCLAISHSAYLLLL
jgi:hypothetical protein